MHKQENLNKAAYWFREYSHTLPPHALGCLYCQCWQWQWRDAGETERMMVCTAGKDLDWIRTQIRAYEGSTEIQPQGFQSSVSLKASGNWIKKQDSWDAEESRRQGVINIRVCQTNMRTNKQTETPPQHWEVDADTFITAQSEIN